MKLGTLRGLIVGTVAVALAASVPAGAQTYSMGYKFLKAVKDRDRNEVNELLDKPGSTVINSRDVTSGETALHIAVNQRDLTWLRFLTSRGANPNIDDKKGVTPLMLACRIGFTEGAEALVAAGARVDDPNDAGETPLIFAVHSRDTGLMRALLKAGADPDRNDNSGRSARDYARLEGRNSPTLAEIERSAKSKAERDADTSSEVYGPTF